MKEYCKQFSIKRMGQLLNVSRSRYYQAVKPKLSKRTLEQEAESTQEKLRTIRAVFDPKLLQCIDRLLQIQKKKKGYALKKELFIQAIEKFVGNK